VTSGEDRKKLLREVFITFKNAYPQVFATLFTNDEKIQEWGELWCEITKDLTNEQIIHAVKKIVLTSSFAPSAADFRKCALGILPENQAFEIAKQYFIFKNQEQINDLIYKAGCEIQTFDWQSLTEKEIKNRFCSIYENLCSKKLESNKI